MYSNPIFIKVDKGGRLPTKANVNDAGYDLYVPDDYECAQLDSGFWEVDTKVHFVIPVGYVGLLRPRSSATKRGYIIPGGTIDADYTGTIHFFVKSDLPPLPGERLCQIVVVPCAQLRWQFVEELPNTQRGARGFGSSGR